MTDWQPMDTAPRDGTWVFLYRPEPDSGLGSWERFVIGRWFEPWDTWVWPSIPYDITSDEIMFEDLVDNGEVYDDSHGSFTHWCELPDPPQ